MKVYVGTYAKYNNGNLGGEWLDIEDYADKDDFMDACQELHSDESDPEFMFQDHEGIPGNMISESHIKPEVFDLAQLDEHQQLIVELYLDNVNQNGTIEEALEAHAGTGETEADFIASWYEETGQVDLLPEQFRYYVDWDALARDSDFVFVRHWSGLHAFYR